MATLSIPGYPGMGILHPLMKFRFNVLFKDSDGNPIADVLSRQLIQVGERPQPGPAHVWIEIENDVTSLAGRAIQDLMKRDSFTIEIQLIDGNESVIETSTLHNCQVISATHSALDYAGNRATPPHLSVRTERKVGTHVDEIKKNKFAAAILTALSGLHLNFSLGGDEFERAVITTKLDIAYSSIDVTF